MSLYRRHAIRVLSCTLGILAAASGVRGDETVTSVSVLGSTTLSGAVGGTAGEGVSSLEPILNGTGAGLPPFPSDAIGVRNQMMGDYGLVVLQIPPTPNGSGVTAVQARIDSPSPILFPSPFEGSPQSQMPSVPEPGVLSLTLLGATTVAFVSRLRTLARSR